MVSTVQSRGKRHTTSLPLSMTSWHISTFTARRVRIRVNKEKKIKTIMIKNDLTLKWSFFNTVLYISFISPVKRFYSFSYCRYAAVNVLDCLLVFAFSYLNVWQDTTLLTKPVWLICFSSLSVSISINMARLKLHLRQTLQENVQETWV